LSEDNQPKATQEFNFDPDKENLLVQAPSLNQRQVISREEQPIGIKFIRVIFWIVPSVALVGGFILANMISDFIYGIAGLPIYQSTGSVTFLAIWFSFWIGACLICGYFRTHIIQTEILRQLTHKDRFKLTLHFSLFQIIVTPLVIITTGVLLNLILALFLIH